MMHLGDHAIIDVECYEDALRALRGADASFFLYKNKTPPWKSGGETLIRRLYTYRMCYKNNNTYH